MISQKDQYWMKFAEESAQGSLDDSRKCCCVFVRPSRFIYDDLLLTVGVNNFPPMVARTPERIQRPAKYIFTEHAERAAIYQAARIGVTLARSTAYLTWYPCADCARALVLSAIERLVCYEPDWTETRYGFHDARAILEESKIEVIYFGQKQEKAK